MLLDAKRWLLVVEDNPAQQYILDRELKQAGFDVTVVGSVQAAFATVAGASVLPHAIVLDVNLPDGSGFDICRDLKQDARTAAIPVIFLTSSHQTGAARDRGMFSGADAFLFAPVETQQLVAVIQGCIQKHATT